MEYERLVLLGVSWSVLAATLQNVVVRAECLTSSYECKSGGECLKWKFYCDGQCDCNDCSDELEAECHKQQSANSDSGSMMSTAAVVGIIIGAICLLLLIVIGLVVLIICRKRRLASKTQQRHQVPPDLRALQESGHGLPIDIPVEALQREPPPRYEEFSTSSSRHLSTTGLPAEADMSIGSISIHQQPPPPPYSYEISAVASSVGMSSSSYFDSQSIGGMSFDAPPMYQSRVDLSRSAGSSLRASPRAARRAGSSSTGRLRSIDSFMEFPSMSDILLTSSRSSLPISDSAAGAASGGSHSRSGTSSRRTTSTDSAHGDSFVSSPSSTSGDDRRRRLGGERPPQERSQSMSDIAVAHGGTSIDRNVHPAATSTECVSSSTVERRAKRARASRTATRPNCNNATTAISSAEATDSYDAAESCCVTEEIHERESPRYATGNKQRRQIDDRSAGGRRAHRAQCHSMPQMATVDEETIQTDSNGIVGSVV